MEGQKINYVCIQSYNYKMEDIMKYQNNFMEIIKKCKMEYDEYEKDKDDKKINRQKLINYSRLEILKSETLCRFFLDIENLNENSNIEFIDINNYKIPKFLEEFEEYMGFNHHSFTITLNNNSVHKGLSYHVIWPYVIKFMDIKKYIIDFINHNNKYVQYIDSSIYSTRRIFRCPYQYKPAIRKDPRRINDYHKIIFSNNIIDIDNNLDVCISNSILQNIYNLENVNKDININFDDINKYTIMYKESKKKESEQLHNNQLNNIQQESKEPFEKMNENKQTNQTKETVNTIPINQPNQTDNKNNVIEQMLNIAKNNGIDVNNPEDILKLISQMISINNSN